MSINGVGYGAHIQPRLQGPGEGATREPLAVQGTPKPPPTIGIAAAAPPGTDPELWSMLTAEERDFFDKAQSLGPVTYGPNAASADPALPRGARLDLRV